MYIYVFICLAILLGLVNCVIGKHNDKKSLDELQKATKNKPFVRIYNIAGYGGGYIEFLKNNQKFYFCTQKYLNMAVDLFKPQQIVSMLDL